MRPVAVAIEMTTAYGCGIDATWNGLLSGKSALSKSSRFPNCKIGTIPRGSIGALSLLEPLLTAIKPALPQGTMVFLATTTGEVELLEDAVSTGLPVEAALDSDPSHLLRKICDCLGDVRAGTVISAACASSTIAVARAASLIRSGQKKSVLVVASDALSDFVFAGFSTMNALAPDGAQPFDANRQGLSLGEAAAVMLIMDEATARQQGRPILGEIAGAATTSDGFHVTRPEPSGVQLARACEKAVSQAERAMDEIRFVCAHGTGTKHNDAMEMAAFASIMTPRPVFSVKGGLGHTLGAAGLVEIALTFRALSDAKVPPTVNLDTPDSTAAGWVSFRTVPLCNPRAALTTNCGFGGINAAMVLTIPD